MLKKEKDGQVQMKYFGCDAMKCLPRELDTYAQTQNIHRQGIMFGY